MLITVTNHLLQRNTKKTRYLSVLTEFTYAAVDILFLSQIALDDGWYVPFPAAPYRPISGPQHRTRVAVMYLKV